MNEKNSWILRTLLVVLIAPVSLVIVFSVGLFYGNIPDFTLDTYSSIISALSTLCIAVLTIFLANETWKLRDLQIKQIEQIRRAAIRPSLDIYLESSIASMQFMDLYLENNGEGSARNIKFSFTGKNNSELEENQKKIVAELSKFNMLKIGVSSLSPNKKRSSYIFSFIDLYKDLGDELFDIVLEIHINFTDHEGFPYKSISVIDFAEYKGMTEMGGGNPTYNMYKELEKIRKIFEGFQGSMSSKRLKVDVYKPSK